MGKQKQKIDTLERRIREVEASNKIYCNMLKDLLDRLIKIELNEKNKRERESMELSNDLELVEAKDGFLFNKKKEKEDQNGVQKSGE